MSFIHEASAREAAATGKLIGSKAGWRVYQMSDGRLIACAISASSVITHGEAITKEALHLYCDDVKPPAKGYGTTTR